MRTLFLTLLATVSLTASAQNIKLINATSQSWSGGVAGHHGTNYAVQIECSDTNFKPDTLWIGEQIYSPVTITPGDSTVKKYDKKLHTFTYTLFAYESYIDPGMYGYDAYYQAKKQKGTEKQPTKKYTGAALVSYKYHGKKCYFIVKALTQQPPLCYP